MFLCQVCNSANNSVLEIGDCQICKNKAALTDRMISEALVSLAKEGIFSFSISTIIPKEWLTQEEGMWDREIQNCQSIKNFLNKKISTEMQKLTGLTYTADGDCRVIFDYSTGNVQIERNEIFVFGRYMKLVPGLSQSRWICSLCQGKGCKGCENKGKRYESVEERIGEPIKKAAEASDYVLHASGREDVDAINTAGRPFVLAIKNPNKRRLDLDEITRQISKSGEVSVHNLAIVERPFVEVVTESHFDKGYEATVEFERELSDENIREIKTLEGKTIAQQTPNRVAHRRADLIRHRKIKNIDVAAVDGKNAVLKITAEAGTYIKELISGDEGRTNPSISGILGTNARCKKLVVTKIDDGFLDLCLKTKT